MIFRLYKNNDELGAANVGSIDEALWHFIIRDIIPQEVLEEMELNEAGLTAVMPEGDVWQIRSLLMNIMDWKNEKPKCSKCGEPAETVGHLQLIDDKWYCDTDAPKEIGANRRLFWRGNRYGLNLRKRKR